MNVPESKVEVKGVEAKFYNSILDIISAGQYGRMVKKAVTDMHIAAGEKILDLGCGTGYNDCIMLKHAGKSGKVVGLDIGDEMIRQFEKRCAGYENASIENLRIEDELPFKDEFDRVFTSFVFHGFPIEAQRKIIHNAYDALKPGAKLTIFDYAEFDLAEKPWWFRLAFKAIECPLAFKYIKTDWKKALAESGFAAFEERFYFKKTIRLLTAVKVADSGRPISRG